MPDDTQVRVLGPDNKYYKFPTGTTKDQAVSYFKKKNILSPETKPPAAQVTPPPVKPGTPPAAGGPSFESQHPFYAGVAKGQGLDPEKLAKYGGTEALRESTINFGKMIEDVVHDPFNVAKIFDSMATNIESGVGTTAKGVWEGDKQKMQFGAGMTLSALGQILGGAEGAEKIKGMASQVDGGIKAAHEIATKTGVDVGEATRVAHRATNKTPSRFLKTKAFNDAYVHAKGLDVAKKVGKAADAIHEEIKTHADGIASQIDTKIPQGVIDATGVAKNIIDTFREEVKAPEKANPLLTSMIKDATSTAPGMWTWEKARQLRSSVGRVMGKVSGPQRVVLTEAYKDLTTKLGSTAKQYGLERSWNHYNELARKTDKHFADIIDDVRSAKAGHQVAQKLDAHRAYSAELINNLSKYGLDAKEVNQYIKDAARMKNQASGMRGSLFRLAYGTPVGIPVMVAARMGGAPWIAGLAAGAAAGYLSSYLINMARAARLSPDVIEVIARSRELPGRMKFEEGEFPGGGPPQLPAPKGEPTEPKQRLLRAAEVPDRPKVKGEEVQPMAPEEKAAIEKVAGRKLSDEEAIVEQRKQQEHQSVEALAKGKVDVKAKESAGLKDKGVSAEAELRKRAAEGEHVPGAHYTDEGLRQTFKIPHSTSLSSLVDAGAVVRNEDGTFSLESDTRARRIAKEGEVGREPGAKLGTTKESAIGRRTKARERVEKAREKAKRSKMSEAEEAKHRAQATGMDVSALQIPEMEEYLKAKRPNELRSLQALRKKGIPDGEYIEGLKYLILEGLEESE